MVTIPEWVTPLRRQVAKETGVFLHTLRNIGARTSCQYGEGGGVGVQLNRQLVGQLYGAASAPTRLREPGHGGA